MTELADTSAWVWSRKAALLRHEFDTALVDGNLATCGMVRLELLYSARNAGEFARSARSSPHSPTARSARSSGTARYAYTSN